MQKKVIRQLSKRLRKIGKELGFRKLKIRSRPWGKYLLGSSRIYVINKHALEIHIDWRDFCLCAYGVYLRNGELPDKHVIYNYPDGEKCRTFLTEIYKTKITYPKKYKNIKFQLSPEFLFYQFDFCMQLIQNDPATLKAFFESLD